MLRIDDDCISANRLYQLASTILPSYVTREDWEKPLAGRTIVHKGAVDGVLSGVMNYARARVRREKKG